jgi:hypothetical protein
MRAMSESLVDLSYRGLSLGRRVKLTQVRPSTGYVEVPAPMPVGTAIAIATDEGITLDAVVAEVHEQVSGVERAPGMLVRPALATPSAEQWWKDRVALPELDKPAPVAVRAPQVSTVLPKRMTAQGASAVPELIDDGRNTAVMEVPVDGTDPGVGSGADRPSNPDLVDDGKRTTAMDAVDLAALGLDPSAATTGQIPVFGDDDEPSNGDRPSESKIGGRKKRKKR